jgi:cleavage and polyadenylation specificity factor subunit 2
VPQFTSIPIYATAPVISLGRALLQDVYSSTRLAASIIPQSTLIEAVGPDAGKSTSNFLPQPPTNEEIAHYFGLIHPLKYSQPHEPLTSPWSPPLNGLTITAYSAGHSLGGTIWHVQHELESIVYAVDWNQAKDAALQAAAWLGAGGGEVIESLRRPTALICSSRASQREVLPGGRESRDEHLIKLIKQTIAVGGSVLIPSDSCGRALELAYFLEEAWTQDSKHSGLRDSLQNAGVYFASASASLTVRFAKSMLEWMDDGVVREFEAAAQNNQNNRNQDGNDNRTPFDFKHLKTVERKSQMRKLLAKDGPKVILATDLSMEWGYAKSLLEDFASNKKNMIILSEPIEQTSMGRDNLGHSLWNLWMKKSTKRSTRDMAAVVDPSGKPISYRHTEIEPLEGTDLAIYQQYLAKERSRQWAITTADTGNNLVADDAISESSSSSEESVGDDMEQQQQGKALNVSTTLGHARHKANLTDAELGIDILIRRKGHYDYDVLGKRGRERMFPILPARKNQRFDDYGEVIRPEDYLRSEERENIDPDQPQGKGSLEKALGQKRKWGESQTLTNGAATVNGNGMDKRRKLGDESRMEVMTDAATLRVNGHGGLIEVPSDDEAEDEEQDKRTKGPVRAVFSVKTISIHSRIGYVDFSGLHDRRSMQMLIPLIRPRKLVLIGGTAGETAALKAECEKLLGIVAGAITVAGEGSNKAEIFTPAMGETLNASVDTNAWNVKLSWLLRQQIHWQTVGGLGVVPLTSHLKVEPLDLASLDTKSKVKRIKAAEDEQKLLADGKTPAIGEEGVPVLDIVPSSRMATTRIVARPLHVGDIRLSDLRKLMQLSGFAAEFRGEGTLLVNGIVAIRKSAVGKVEVEGVIGAEGWQPGDERTFDEVRRRVYDGLAVVHGV